MPYTPTNNPYAVGDPYMYDLKWLVDRVKNVYKDIDDFIAYNKLTFLGTWDGNKNYPAWSIVQDADGNGYLAIKAVPKNVSLDDTDYWALIGNYDALFNAFNARLTALEDKYCPYATPEDYGAVGDGVTDDTAAINTALTSSNLPLIFNGTYLVSIPALSGYAIEIPSNRKLIINGSIILKENNYHIYDMIRIGDANNVSISGCGSIIGDRILHTGNIGEWGHVLTISGSDNISVTGITIKNAWGDGIYVRKSHYITIDNVIADNNRRNGCSIISGANIQVVNSKFVNTNGTAPENGIDVEPNNDDTELFNILIANCDCSNNAGTSFGCGNRYVDNASMQFDNITANGVTIRNETENSQISVNNVNIQLNIDYYPVTVSNTKNTSHILFNNMVVDLDGRTVSGVIYYPNSYEYNITFDNCVFKNGNTDRAMLWSAGSPRGSNDNRFINSIFDIPATTSTPLVPSSDPVVWYGNSIFTGSRLRAENMVLTTSNHIFGSVSEVTITGTEPSYTATVIIDNRAAAELWIRNQSGVAVTINGNDVSGIVGGNPTLNTGEIAHLIPVPIVHKLICTIYTP